jgi:hypothetical protein
MQMIESTSAPLPACSTARCGSIALTTQRWLTRRGDGFGDDHHLDDLAASPPPILVGMR